MNLQTMSRLSKQEMNETETFENNMKGHKQKVTCSDQNMSDQ